MHFLILTKVNIRIKNLFWVFTINFIRIQPSRSFNQIYNTKVFLKKYKAIQLGWVAEQKSQITGFYLDNKKNNYSQSHDKSIILGYY